jgi:ribosomal protein S6
MKSYEAMIILRPDLDEKGREEIREKISQEVQSNKGEWKKWDVWKDKHNFSYALQSRGAERTKFDQGTYILAEFSLDSQKLKDIKYRLDLEERVLRYLLLSKEEV